MGEELIVYIIIGFVAQLVDSSLGMAFGSLSSSLLLAIGFPAQFLSGTVHMAEVFGGSASAFSHWRLGNIDKTLLKKLALPAIIGSIIGALLVTQFNNESLKPWLGGYFTVIGSVILIKAIRPTLIRTIKAHRETLGFIGGFLDSFGGAGWGEFVSSGLLLRGQEIRTVVGSLSTVEFMVSVIVSLVFFSTIGIYSWGIVLALAFGAILAAPLGAWVCKKAPAKPLMIGVGVIIVLVGLKTIFQAL